MLDRAVFFHAFHPYEDKGQRDRPFALSRTACCGRMSAAAPAAITAVRIVPVLRRLARTTPGLSPVIIAHLVEGNKQQLRGFVCHSQHISMQLRAQAESLRNNVIDQGLHARNEASLLGA